MTIKLSLDEIDLLSNLVGAPVFVVLQKLCEQQKEIVKEHLVGADTMDKVRALQGQIAGINLVTNIPKILVAQRAEQKANAAAKEKSAEKRGQKPKA